jgi:hypothetical protein
LLANLLKRRITERWIYAPSVLDWLHRHIELAPCVRNLRHREARRDVSFRVFPRRVPRTQAVALHLCHGHGRPLLHHRRPSQDLPATCLAAGWLQASSSQQGHGRDALHLRLFLLHGLGSSSVRLSPGRMLCFQVLTSVFCSQMGLRLGHLPHSHTALRSRDGECVAVVLQLHRLQVDAGDEDRARVQDLPHVRDDQHRRHGHLQLVRLFFPVLLSVVIAKRRRDPRRLIPETKGRSLEEMDIIFGTVQAEKRRADIEQEQRVFAQAHPHDETSVRSENLEKV